MKKVFLALLLIAVATPAYAQVPIPLFTLTSTTASAITQTHMLVIGQTSAGVRTILIPELRVVLNISPSSTLPLAAVISDTAVHTTVTGTSFYSLNLIPGAIVTATTGGLLTSSSGFTYTNGQGWLQSENSANGLYVGNSANEVSSITRNGGFRNVTGAVTVNLLSSSAIYVANSASTAFGVGTTNPVSKLDVNGSLGLGNKQFLTSDTTLTSGSPHGQISLTGSITLTLPSSLTTTNRDWFFCNRGATTATVTGTGGQGLWMGNTTLSLPSGGFLHMSNFSGTFQRMGGGN